MYTPTSAALQQTRENNKTTDKKHCRQDCNISLAFLKSAKLIYSIEYKVTIEKNMIIMFHMVKNKLIEANISAHER